MTLQRQQQTAAKRPSPNPGVPQAWWEWWASIWDPYTYTLAPQRYGVTISAAANQARAQDNIQVPEPVFVFGLRSRAMVAAGTAWPASNYRIGFATAAGDNWAGGTWLAALVTGDVGNTFMRDPDPWQTPRELAANEQVVVTIDNSLNAAITVVDVNLIGFVNRRRTMPLR